MSYFRLKKELNWVLRKFGIVVYEGNKKIELVINTDKNIEIFKFLKFLSEFKSKSDVEKYVELTDTEKNDTINYLLSKNFLQEFDQPITLTRTDLFVNSFPEVSFEAFNKYRKKCRIILIGLGTVGSNTLDFLVRLGFRQFVLIDGDKVEEKNLSAQTYFPNEIGRYKVDVMKERYNNLFFLKTHNGWIKNVTDLIEISGYLNKNDVIINAADDYTLMGNLAESIMKKLLSCTVIESGYGPLLQTAYVIDSVDAAKIFYDYINDLTKVPIDSIYENSGSIINGYMSAVMIGQMILSSFTGKQMRVADYNLLDNCLTWKEHL